MPDASAAWHCETAGISSQCACFTFGSDLLKLNQQAAMQAAGLVSAELPLPLCLAAVRAVLTCLARHPVVQLAATTLSDGRAGAQLGVCGLLPGPICRPSHHIVTGSLTVADSTWPWRFSTRLQGRSAGTKHLSIHAGISARGRAWHAWRFSTRLQGSGTGGVRAKCSADSTDDEISVAVALPHTPAACGKPDG